MKISQKAYQKYLKGKLGTDATWAKKALVLIYNNQTEDEKYSEMTVVENGIGFTGSDAEILTSFAKQLISKEFLSPKQMSMLFRKIPKYWKQVLNASDKEKLDAMVT